MKKLVYLYIINYSRKKPDQAIMVISLLRKDVMEGSPIIKGIDYILLFNYKNIILLY